MENDLKDSLTDSDGHLSTNNGDMMEKAKRDVMGEWESDIKASKNCFSVAHPTEFNWSYKIRHLYFYIYF